MLQQSTRPLPTLSLRSKTVSNTITSHDLEIIQKTSCNADVKVAKQIQLEPRSATSITVVSTERSLMVWSKHSSSSATVAACKQNYGSDTQHSVSNTSNQHPQPACSWTQRYHNGTTMQYFDENCRNKLVAPNFNRGPIICCSSKYCPNWMWNYILSKRRQDQITNVMLSIYRITMSHTVMTSFLCSNHLHQCEMDI